jgi:signal transduction histidine kinase
MLKRLNIKARIIAVYTILFGILLALVGYGSLFILERMYVTKIDSYLMAYSNIVVEKLPNYLEKKVINKGAHHFLSNDEQDKFMEVFRIFRRWSVTPPKIYIQVLEKDGETLITDPLLTNPRHKPDWSRALEYQPDLSTITIDSIPYRTFRKRFGIPEPGGPIFLLEAAVSLSDLDRLRDHIAHRHMILIAVALLISGLAGYYIARYAFKPVSIMAKTAAAISASNLDQRLELPKAKDEIHFLGETMNAMIQRIDNAFKTQQQFVADASHEIRTPLTIIQAELELAKKRVTDPETMESIDVSLQELEHLNTLTGALLTLARLDASENKLDIQPVRIDEMLMESVQGLQTIGQRKEIKLELSISEAIEASVDSQKIKKVFRNVIENAIKYSPVKSVVIVNLDKDQEDRIRVTVKDEGAGISEKALAHIFDRFYRAPELRSQNIGSGLGLAIVKKIIELHKGDIKVSSTPGKGSTFTILLPNQT